MSQKSRLKPRHRKNRKERRAALRRGPLAGNALQQLKARLEVTEPIIDGPLGSKKLSDVIYDFAEPLLEVPALELEDVENALRFAIVLWNLSFLPEEKQKDFLSQQTTIIEADRFENFTGLVRHMVERRRTYFTDHPYLVTDYEIVRKGSAVDFAVKYAPAADAVTPLAIGF